MKLNQNIYRYATYMLSVKNLEDIVLSVPQNNVGLNHYIFQEMFL